MIERVIERKCGHFEKIAIMGFSGDNDDILIEHKADIEKISAWQKGIICSLCFEKLPTEEQQKLLKKEIING